MGRFDLAILVAGERGGMVFMSDFKKWNMYILWLIRQMGHKVYIFPILLYHDLSGSLGQARSRGTRLK